MAQAPEPRRQSAARPRKCPYVLDRRAGDPSRKDETLRKPGPGFERRPNGGEVDSHARLWYSPDRDAMLEAGYRLMNVPPDALKFPAAHETHMRESKHGYYGKPEDSWAWPGQPIGLPYQSDKTIKAFLIGAQAVHPEWFDPAACAIEPTAWEHWGVPHRYPQYTFKHHMVNDRGAKEAEERRVTYETGPGFKSVPLCGAWPIADQLFDEVVVDGVTKQVVDRKQLIYYSDSFLSTVWQIMTPTRRVATIKLGWELMGLEGYERDSYPILKPINDTLSREEKEAFGLGVQTAYAKSFEENACTFHMQDVIDDAARELALLEPSAFCQESGGSEFDPENGSCFYRNEAMDSKTTTLRGRKVTLKPDRCQAWPGKNADLRIGPSDRILPSVKREQLLAAFWKSTHPDRRRLILRLGPDAELMEDYTKLSPRQKEQFATDVARRDKTSLESLDKDNPVDHIQYLDGEEKNGCTLEIERLLGVIGHYPGPPYSRLSNNLCFQSGGSQVDPDGPTSGPKNGGPVVCNYRAH